jgi:hypothetical protein
LNLSAPGILFFGLGIVPVRTTGLTAAAAGFFAGTAPHKKHYRDQYNDEGKKLLPIHEANITVKANRATGIF